MDGSRSWWQLVSDRVFGPYLRANLNSSIGNRFQTVAAAIVVFGLTGSNTLVGVVAAVQFGSTLLLGPWAGSLANRFDRRRIVLFAGSIAAAGACALALRVLAVGIESLPGMWPILAATAAFDLRDGLGAPALDALVPSLVGRQDLDKAIALFSTSFRVARAVGPALAGLAIAAAGVAIAFSRMP